MADETMDGRRASRLSKWIATSDALREKANLPVPEQIERLGGTYICNYLHIPTYEMAVPGSIHLYDVYPLQIWHFISWFYHQQRRCSHSTTTL